MPVSGPNFAGAVGTQGAGWTLGANAVGSVETSCAENADTANAAFWNTYGFAIPTGNTINGIQVEFKASWDADPRLISTVNVGKNETTLGTAKVPGALPEAVCGAGQTIFSLGGGADLWGLTWTPAEINAASFTARFAGDAVGGSIFLNWIRITITHTAGAGALLGDEGEYLPRGQTSEFVTTVYS